MTNRARTSVLNSGVSEVTADATAGVAPGSPAPTRHPSGMPPLLDLGLRTAFALGERLAPAAAGRLAESLFTRIPPAPAAERRQRDYPAGALTRLRVGDRDVVVERFGTTGPVITLVHGWGGWRQQLYAVVAPLLAAGFSVVAHDAPGHGDSGPGELGPGRSSMVEAAEVLSAVARHVGPVHATIAHSGGGMATVWALATQRSGLQVDRLVLIATTAHTQDMLTWFGARFGIGPRSLAAMVARLERRFAFSMPDLDALASVELLRGLDARADADADGRLPDLLLVHDRDDPDTPWHGSVDLHRGWPGSELELTDGLGHRRVLWDRDVVARVCDFLTR